MFDSKITTRLADAQIIKSVRGWKLLQGRWQNKVGGGTSICFQVENPEGRIVTGSPMFSARSAERVFETWAAGSKVGAA